MPTYSREEVREHNRRKDSWYILFNSVYDLSDFLDEHPGGMEFLLFRAGTDITSFFSAKHAHNKAVYKRLETFRIGELPEHERVDTAAFDEPFFSELLEKCERERLFDVPRWYNNQWFYVRLASVLAFFGFSYLALYTNVHWSCAITAVIIQAIIGTSLFGLLAHEATHRDFPENGLTRFLLAVFWPVFWPFILKDPLMYEHNNHHVKIGDPEYDYEVAGFAEVIRYSGTVSHKKSHRFQHRLAAFTYPFYANIITTIGGLRSGYWQKHNRPIGYKQVVALSITATYFLILPMLMGSSFWWCLLLYVLYQCVLYVGIYIGAAINHFIPSTTEPIPEEHQNHFGYYVCHHTSNFGQNNPLLYWYTGGFNVQVEHHLIPFVPVENLRKMVPLVKELCKKYDYPYRQYQGLLDLWKDHYAFLAIMANSSDSELIVNEIRNKAKYQAR